MKKIKIGNNVTIDSRSIVLGGLSLKTMLPLAHFIDSEDSLMMQMKHGPVLQQ